MTFFQLRTWTRLLRVGSHLVYGAAIIACIYPWVSGATRAWLRQHWSRCLIAILNVRLRVSGHHSPNHWPSHRPIHGMLVSNHISWLDVFVINSIYTPVFVCKDDVRRWPFVGWLCARNDAVFIDRRRRSDARRVSFNIGEMLRKGMLVAAFPEGTTSDGSGVLPFRGALLQAAVDAGCAALPLALRYLDAQERPTTSPSYCGDATLWDSLRAIAAQSALTVEVRALPPIACAGRTRRAVAEEAHAGIRAHLGVAQPTAHRDAAPHGTADGDLEPAVIFP
jgi:1-acyl-sn-glycerol-3-phosphate acyltransferase